LVGVDGGTREPAIGGLTWSQVGMYDAFGVGLDVSGSGYGTPPKGLAGPFGINDGRIHTYERSYADNAEFSK